MKTLTNKIKNNRNKLISIILMLMVFVFITAGCTRFDINIGIDESNTAYLSYHLEFDLSKLNERQQHSFRVALYQIAIHYQQNLDFNVHLDLESSPIVFEAEKRVMNNSFEEAFESLKAMLTDERMTVFMQVDMDSIEYSRQRGYIFNASTDINRILQSGDIEEMPPGIRHELEYYVETGAGTITITMPADEIVTASHYARINNGQLIMTVPLEFTGQTEFELSAKQNLIGGVTDDSLIMNIGATFANLLQSALSDSDDITIAQQIYFRSTAQLISLISAILTGLILLITVIVAIVKRR